MCGILAAFGLTGTPVQNRRELLKLSKLLRHRGPDANSAYVNDVGDVVICHERLQIVDVSDAGRQPMFIKRPEGDIVWATNSEIYNHEHIRKTLLAGVDLRSGSDSAVVGHLYKKLGCTPEMVNVLDGVFACVIYDGDTGDFFAFRDAIGICPMYWGKDSDGAMWFASEMKAIQDVCEVFDIFQPGCVFSSKDGRLRRWYTPVWRDLSLVPSQPADLNLLKTAFIRSVVKRLMSDAPLGMLLSGGLDSSLVASVAVRHIKESKNAYNKNERLHTFSIGIKGAPDLKAARQVADFLGTNHHECHFTVEEGLDAVRDLIWHTESFEQVRAAVPMYILARKIKALGIKVVLSGEGADEIFGGYLYFHKAPNPEEFHRETVRKITRLHQWDVLRANKAPFAWGLEPRVPFLDKDFLQVAMNIHPKDKMIDMKEKPDGVHKKMEKYLLRKAFDDKEHPYLPEDVLFRQKEQFSDGVGYDWVDGLKEYAEKVVTEDMWAWRAKRFPIDPPRTREYYLLRSYFEEQFPSKAALMTVPRGLSVACSTPEAVNWDPEWKNLHEISGRAIGVHVAAKPEKPSDNIPIPKTLIARTRHDITSGEPLASPSPAENVILGMSPA